MGELLPFTLALSGRGRWPGPTLHWHVLWMTYASCPRGHFSDREPTTPTRICRWWTSTSLFSKLAHPQAPTFICQVIQKTPHSLRPNFPPGLGYAALQADHHLWRTGTRVSPHTLVPEQLLDCSQAGCPLVCVPQNMRPRPHCLWGHTPRLQQLLTIFLFPLVNILE